MRYVASTVDLVLHTAEGAHRSGRGIAVAQTVEGRTAMSAKAAGWVVAKSSSWLGRWTMPWARTA